MKNVLKLVILLSVLSATASSLRAEQDDGLVVEDEPVVENEKIWRSGPGVWEMGPPDQHNFYIVPNFPDEGYAYIDPGPMYWEEADPVTTVDPKICLDEPIEPSPNTPPNE